MADMPTRVDNDTDEEIPAAKRRAWVHAFHNSPSFIAACKEDEAACELRAAEMRFENLHSEGADGRVISEAVLALQGFNNLLQQREQETQKVFHCQAEQMWGQSEDERALQALARLEQEAHNDYLVVETTAMNIMDEMDEGLQ